MRSPQKSQSVGEVLRRDLPPALQLALKLSELQGLWSNLVDPPLADLTRPVSLDREGLVVICQSPAAAQRLKMSAGGLLRRISRRWGLDLPGIRPVVASLEAGRRDSQRPGPPAREIKPREDAVEACYQRIRPQIGRDDVSLALARLEALYKLRFGDGPR